MFSNQRRLAVTEKSLGFVDRRAREGDKIVIVVGCSVPLVISRMAIEQAELWYVKGECYIEGLMEGEVAEVPQPEFDIHVQPQILNLV